MLNSKELKKIVKALPTNGYQLVSDKLNGEYTSETIRKYLGDPKRCNIKIIDAAFQIIEAEKAAILAQKERVKQLNA